MRQMNAVEPPRRRIRCEVLLATEDRHLSNAHPILIFIEDHLLDMTLGVGCLFLSVLLGAGVPRLRTALKRRRNS
jgi:hypothetical protein